MSEAQKASEKLKREGEKRKQLVEEIQKYQVWFGVFHYKQLYTEEEIKQLIANRIEELKKKKDEMCRSFVNQSIPAMVSFLTERKSYLQEFGKEYRQVGCELEYLMTCFEVFN